MLPWLCSFVFLLCVFSTIVPIFCVDPSTLRHVNVVFRHGDRTPVIEELYPNDGYGPEFFKPFGLGQLTNTGKRRAYESGAIMRTRYGNFLGNFYQPNLIKARSTDTDRTKMTLQLALASLFPPMGVEEWNPFLKWQPVPYRYVPRLQDNTLLQIYYCDKYLSEYNKTVASDRVKKLEKQYEKLMNYASMRTGTNISTLYDLYNLEQSLKTKVGLFLLPFWAPKLLEELKQPAIDQLYVYNLYPTLIKRNGGVLLSQMIKNMRAMMKGEITERMHLYSSHDVNIAAILFALNVFKPHTPEFTSSVFLELHQIKNQYYVKIVYYRGIPSQMMELTIPGCQTLCPFNEFVNLVQKNLPSKEDICGGQVIDDYLDSTEAPF